MAISIRIKRGTEANILAATLAAGEMAFATDTKAVFVSDGTLKNLVGKSLSGTFAARPSFGVAGRTYYDSTNNVLWVDTGSAWVQPQIVYASEANIPTADQKAALAGTNGTPAAANKFVTNSDPRLGAVGTIEAHSQAATTITGGAFTAGNYTFPAAASGTTLTIHGSTGDAPVVGPTELVTNGAFTSNADNWTVGEGWEYDAGNARMSHIPNRISTINISSGGSGYSESDVVSIDGGTAGSLGTATVASVSGGVVTGVTLTTGGRGYPTIPSVSASTATTYPSARRMPATCYDPVNNQMLLFGGNTAASTYSLELWAYAFATDTWTQLSYSGSATARSEGYAVYDSTNHAMLIFGGYRSTNSSEFNKYDIATNTMTTITGDTNRPSARSSGNAWYDPTSHCMFIFGGYIAAGTNELHKYDIAANTWTQITDAGTAPSARYNFGCAFDSHNREAWIFKGNLGTTTFKYKVATNAWEQVTVTGTSMIPTSLQVANYDARQKCFYLFGGYDGTTAYNNLYKMTTAGVVSGVVVQSGTLPIGRYGHVGRYSPTSMKMFVGFGVPNSTSFLSDGATIQFESTLSTTPANLPTVAATGGTPPAARYGMARCFDSTNNALLIFGGATTGNVAETWRYSIASDTWTQLSPSGTPPSARRYTIGTYDSTNHCFWVFGGYTSVSVGGLFKYDIAGNSWSQVSASGEPSARQSVQMCYDVTSHALYVFGGWTTAAVNDMYKFDIATSTWTTLSPGGTIPIGRYGSANALDTDTREWYIFNGQGAATILDCYKYNIARNVWIPLPRKGSPITTSQLASSACYDSHQKCFYLFSGATTITSLYKITKEGFWSVVTPASGSLVAARYAHATVYSPASRKVVVWGGYNTTTLYDGMAITTSSAGAGLELNALDLCTASMEQNVGAAASCMYRTVFTTTRSAGSLTPYVGSNDASYSAAVVASATNTQDIYASGTGNLKFTPSCDFNGSLDAVSCKRIYAATPSIIYNNASGTLQWELYTAPNPMIGYLNGRYNTSTSPLGIGYRALRNTTTASYPIAIGRDALYSLTTGANNIAIGYTAMMNATTAQQNVAIGVSSFTNSISASGNVAVGASSLYSNTIGDYNVAVGHNAAYYQKAASLTVAIGAQSHFYLVSGNSNIGVGYKTGFSLVKGNKNISIGTYALYSLQEGADNVAIGANAGYNITANSYNCIIGTNAGYSCLGTSNVMLGTNAGYSETGSNKLYISNTTTTTPLIYGEFDNNLLKIKGDIKPATDDTYDLGGSSNRWDDIYATNSTIQTSDLNKKDSITDIGLGLEFINKLRPVSFKWKDYTYTEQVALPIEYEDVEVEYTDMETDEEGNQVEVTRTRIESQPKPQEFEERTVEKTFRRKHSGLIAQEVKDVLDELEVSTLEFAGYVDTYDNGLALRYEEFIAPVIKAIQELSARVEALES